MRNGDVDGKTNKSNDIKMEVLAEKKERERVMRAQIRALVSK